MHTFTKSNRLGVSVAQCRDIMDDLMPRTISLGVHPLPKAPTWITHTMEETVRTNLGDSWIAMHASE